MVAFDNNYRTRLWASAAEAQAVFASATGVATLALMTLEDEQALWSQSDGQAQLQRTLTLPCTEVVVMRG